MKILSGLIIIALIAGANPRIASADINTKQCISVARLEGDSCRRNCTADQDDAVVTCRTRARGNCGAACGSIFSECLAPIKAETQACRSVCNTAFREDRSVCAATAGCTLDVNCGASESFFQCVTRARTFEAQCNVACNRDLTRRLERRSCSRALNSCLKTCR